MQFIAKGPDIPDDLLQAHEDGSVVFFCGAGISYPARLPGFKELVDRLYRLLGTTRTAIETKAHNRKQFDGTLDLLAKVPPTPTMLCYSWRTAGTGSCVSSQPILTASSNG